MLEALVELEDAHNHPAHESREDPFMALLLYFDAFILGEAPKGYKGNPNLLVKHRLRDLYEGHIPKLYREAYSIEPQSTPPSRPSPDDNRKACSAQRAADLDKLFTCCDRLDHVHGIAPLTDENL